MAALAVGLAAVAFVWYQGQAVVPDGQPPLVTIDAAALAALRADFNRDHEAARIIVLLSPT